MSDTLHITVDGDDVEAAAGQTILAACDAAGHYIPRLCYKDGLPPGGHCRLCVVRANGRYVAACHTPVADGMRVDSDTPELAADRRRIVEMLLVSGQHVCPACERSGSCELQALAYRLGVLAPTLPPIPANEAIDASHPDLYLDRNRCILCTRCVRSVRVLDGKTALGLEGRGLAMRLATNSHDGLGGTDIEASDRAAQACPVGSLVLKRTGFRVPYGERPYDQVPIGTDIDRQAPPPEGGR